MRGRDPTRATVETMRAVCEAVLVWYGETEEQPGWCEDSKAAYRALAAYRAETAVRRTAAERDRLILDYLRTCRESRDGLPDVPGWPLFKQHLERLLDEPVADERDDEVQADCTSCSGCGNPGALCPTGGACSRSMPERDPDTVIRPCGCEETEALKAEVQRLRALTEDQHAPNTVKWRTLLDEERSRAATLHGKIRSAIVCLGHHEAPRNNVMVRKAIEALT